MDSLLTGEENLSLMADLCHLDREEVGGGSRISLDRFESMDAAGRPAATYPVACADVWTWR